MGGDFDHRESPIGVCAVPVPNDVELHNAISRGAKKDLTLLGDHSFYIRNGWQCVLFCEDTPWLVGAKVCSVCWDATEKVTKIVWADPHGFFVDHPGECFARDFRPGE